MFMMDADSAIQTPIGPELSKARNKGRSRLWD